MSFIFSWIDFIDSADQMLSFLFDVMFAAVSPTSIVSSFSSLFNHQLVERITS